MKKEKSKIERLISDTTPDLFRFLRSMSLTKDEAEDVIQDTCEKIIKNDAKSEVINLKAYMYQTARNITLNEFRRKKNKDSALEVIKVNLDNIQADTSSKTYEAKEDLQQVLDAINTLPPKCRKVFILRHIDQLTHREIAEHMSVSIGTVEKHLAKGIRQTHVYFRAIKKGHNISELLKKAGL